MTDNDDPWSDPGWLEYEKHAKEDMLPKLKGSSITIALLGSEADPKQACELGYMILLDKPILAVVQAGTKVPDKLVRVADEIVEMGDMDDPVFKRRLSDAIARVQAKVVGNGEHEG